MDHRSERGRRGGGSGRGGRGRSNSTGRDDNGHRMGHQHQQPRTAVVHGTTDRVKVNSKNRVGGRGSRGRHQNRTSGSWKKQQDAVTEQMQSGYSYSETNVAKQRRGKRRRQQQCTTIEEPVFDGVNDNIPGFYLDPVRKKYFKLRPGQRRPNIVAEATAALDVTSLAESGVIGGGGYRSSEFGALSQINLAASIIGRAYSSSQREDMMRNIVSSLLWKCKRHVHYDDDDDDAQWNISSLKLLTTNGFRDKLLIANDKNFLNQLSVQKYNPRDTSDHIKDTRDGVVMKQIDQFWLGRNDIAAIGYPSDVRVDAAMCICSGGMGHGGTVSLLHPSYMRLNIHKSRSNFWDGEWARDHNIDIGGDGAVHRIDMNRPESASAIVSIRGGHRDSSVLTIAHGDLSGPVSNCIFAGCRGQSLQIVDVREKMTHKLNVQRSRLRSCQSKSITPLRIIAPESHSLISFYSDGDIERYDIRNEKCVTKYLGHKTALKTTKPNLCPKLNLMCAGGSDGVVRIWDISRGGDPVASHSFAVQNTPSCLIADTFGSIPGSASLFVGVGDNLSLFSV